MTRHEPPIDPRGIAVFVVCLVVAAVAAGVLVLELAKGMAL